MKKLSNLITEAKQVKKLDVQDNSINYIPSDQLKKYLEITNKFISEESKEVIKWLIVNNLNYISDLSTDTEENALAGFYNAGLPKEKHLQKLYGLLTTIIKSGRILEVPVFQTKQQFDAIINKKESPDAIILDLTNEASRNRITRQYEPLIVKMCSQWNGKSNLSFDELKSAAYEGFTWAMNKYGKQNDKNKVDLDTIISSMTFGQYAAYMIRVAILEAIKNESQTVRVAVSQQNKERKEKGHNKRNNTISGDKSVSKDNDGGKSIFDFMGMTDETTSAIDRSDLEKLQNEAYSILDKTFNQKILDVFYSFYGLNGHEKLKNKDMAEKYGVSNSNITYYCVKVINHIKHDKKLKELFTEIYELMKESLDIEDDEKQRLEEPVKISPVQNNSYIDE